MSAHTFKQSLTPEERAFVRAFQSSTAGAKLEWLLGTGTPQPSGDSAFDAQRLLGWRACYEAYSGIAEEQDQDTSEQSAIKSLHAIT